VNALLLSGGLDSALLLHHVLENVKASDLLAISVDYGQAHGEQELGAAREVAHWAGVRHAVLQFSNTLAVPEPGGVVPGRNLAFVASSASWLDSAGGGDLFMGICSEDEAGFPDCRAGFVESCNDLLSICELRVRLVAPWLRLSKGEILQKMLGNPGAMQAAARSYSCYLGAANPCGECAACVKRARALGSVSMPACL